MSQELLDALEQRAGELKEAEESVESLRVSRKNLLKASREVVPMHEAAKAAGITRESAWRLIRDEGESR